MNKLVILGLTWFQIGAGKGCLGSQKKINIRVLGTWGLGISISQAALKFEWFVDHMISSIFKLRHLVLCNFFFVLLNWNEKQQQQQKQCFSLFADGSQEAKRELRGKKSHIIKLWVSYGTVNFMAGVETMCSPNCAGRLGQVSFHFTLLGVFIFFSFQEMDLKMPCISHSPVLLATPWFSWQHSISKCKSLKVSYPQQV